MVRAHYWATTGWLIAVAIHLSACATTSHTQPSEPEEPEIKNAYSESRLDMTDDAQRNMEDLTTQPVAMDDLQAGDSKARSAFASARDPSEPMKVSMDPVETSSPPPSASNAPSEPTDSSEQAPSGQLEEQTAQSQLRGSWVGTVNQGSASYHLNMTIERARLDAYAGTTVYTGQPTCNGSLVYEASMGEVHIFRERITQTKKCPDRGRIEVRVNADGRLDWRWWHLGTVGEPRATAVLARVSP